jgi:hypothetical protein
MIANVPIESLPREVRRRLGWYVYRLIDPRNGETFEARVSAQLGSAQHSPNLVSTPLCVHSGHPRTLGHARSVSFEPRSSVGADVVETCLDELLDAPLDLVPDLAHAFERLARRVIDLPVLDLRGDEGAARLARANGKSRGNLKGTGGQAGSRAAGHNR